MPKILVAPDSFKGSLDASQAAEAIKRGLLKACPRACVVTLPMADGGEGTVRSLVSATGGRILQQTVTGPLGEQVEAFYGIMGDGRTAVIEMAAASGLPLLPENRRNPLATTTYGTGELIRAALSQGCRELIIGIGGSATNDGGAGLAQALGISLLDEWGEELPFGGEALARLHRVDLAGLDRRAGESRFLVACDVDNPLCGDRGASRVYGPQKGATPEMVAVLDAALCHFAAIVKRDAGADVLDLPGAGAAGGLGAGLVAFLGAELRRGVDIVIEAVDLPRFAEEADLVITGEGAIDVQTAFGKTPAGVAAVAKRFGRPVIALAGSVTEGARELHSCGIDAMLSIVPGPMSLQDAVRDADKLLERCGETVGRMLEVGRVVSHGHVPTE
ncbi:MAG: glycerate kinase [Firmicutes bacterium]|nr:glycerate kinase [Bacillota bacterium]